MLLKQKSPSLPRNWFSELWQIANTVLNNGKSAIYTSAVQWPRGGKNVIANLDSSRTSGPDCMVLKNCEPELSYILPELFNMCLNKSCFPDCWKVSSVVPVFKNFGERSTAKSSHPVSLISVKNL